MASTMKEFLENALNETKLEEGEEKKARFSKKMKQLEYWTSRNTSTTVNCEDMKKAKAIVKNSGISQKIVSEAINEMLSPKGYKKIRTLKDKITKDAMEIRKILKAEGYEKEADIFFMNIGSETGKLTDIGLF